MLNKVTLIGHLGGNPEYRSTKFGDAMVSFSIATNGGYKDKDTGKNVQTTEWHRIVAYGDVAENMEKILEKGMLVYIEGKLKTNKFTTDEGQDKQYTNIVAGIFKKLRGPCAAGETSKSEDTAGVTFEDDDIPF